MDPRRIYRTAGSTAIIEVLGLGLAYLAQLALARWLGASHYGIYAWSVNAAFFLTVPLLFGMPVRLLRDATPDVIASDPNGVNGLLRRAYQLPIALSLVALALGCLTAWPIRQTGPYPAAIVAGLCAAPFLMVAALNVGVARALGTVVLIKAFEDVLRPSLLLIAALLAMATGLAPSGPLAIAIFAVIAALIAGAQAVILWRLLPVRVRSARPVFHTRRWVIGAAPFALVAGIDVLLRQTDVLMIGLYMTPADVGIYAVAARVSVVVTLPLLAINMIAASAYADLHRRNDHASLQELVHRLAHAMFWPALVLLVTLLLLGEWLLGLFGTDFKHGFGPMLVLAVAGLINVGAGSVGYLANMTGHQWSAVRVQGIAALGNVVLNALLIPAFGLWGAAAATATAVIASNCWLHMLVSRKLRVNASIIHALRNMP